MSVATTWFDAASRFMEKRLPALTRYRLAEALPILLHQRRVYILPTRFGVFFALMLFVMLLGALNFNNNAAILFTLLLAGIVVLSMHRTVANLRGITLEAVHARPVHAGETLKLECHFTHASNSTRQRLRLQIQGVERVFDLPPEGGVITMALDAKQRGWLKPGRIRLWSEFPFGWFWAWTVMNPELQHLIYPEAELKAPPFPETGATRDGRYAKAGGDDLYALREFRDGDPMHQMAWKASARTDRLLVKEFREPKGGDLTLDWHALSGLSHEKRISRLTRWVLEAHAKSRAYRLVLPKHALGPARDTDHLNRCLRDLALLPGAAP